MQKSLVITGAALGFLVLGAIGLVFMQKGAIMVQQSRSQVHAPEFPPGLQWFNTDQPLTIAGLRGKVVLLDFWTYCCINCMHVIPDLKALEQKYPNELVVIGVHSAKFINERDSDNIRQAILRYEIEHPVVNDYEFRVWGAYGVRAWPTLALIDPSGYLIGGVSGEGNFEILEHVISEVIQSARTKGTLDETPRKWPLERAKSPLSPLAFPGKVLADEALGRLCIADSNHHRIVIADLEGNVLDVVGTGREGRADGTFSQATFNHPQGMALDGPYLYVADTENHLIRRLDLPRRVVETLLGTGQQARKFNVPIMYPTLKTCQTYLGSGRPGMKDGQMAEFYEPGGLSLAGDKLYIADTNNHAIRVVDLTSGQVNTLKLAGLAIPDAVAGFEGVAWMEGESINMPLQTVKAGAEGQLVINFELPTGYKLNPAAPVDYGVYVQGDGIQVPNSGRPLSAHAIDLPLTMPLQTSPGIHRAELDIDATFYWCREDNTGVCMIQSTRWHVPVETSETDANRLLTVSTTGQLLDQAGSPLSPRVPLEYKEDGSR